MAEEKLIYRLAPCPARNIDAMEAWLEEMAADGLLLTRDGFFCGFGIFRKDAPRAVRYRLVPTAKRPSIWNDITAPEEEQEALWKRYGWEYLTYREDFHIFRTEDPLANVPPYDRESREQALDVLSKRYRSSILSGVSMSLLFSMLLEGNLVRGVLYLGTWRSLFILAVLVSYVMSSVFKAVHYRRLRRRLEESDRFHRNAADWRAQSLRHCIFSGTQLAATIAMLVMLLTLWAAETEDDGRRPLYDYPGTPPFATLEVLTPTDSRYIRHDSAFLSTNTYRLWSDPLAPVILDWYETGDIHREGETTPDYVSMDLTYYETASPLLAKALARECWWEQWFLSRKYEEYTIPAPEILGVDYARAFMSRHGMVQYVLQKGNVVCHVTHFRSATPLAEKIAVIAASLP